MKKVQMMSEELPILKGILKGNVSYHNARRCLFYSFTLGNLWVTITITAMTATDKWPQKYGQ